ncbi:DUF3299 domain-containing protein [Pseudomonas sp. UL073]|uniref:DUF3299 domain-containing protein n=1 Tax=Zestomonas insulae TaxID=2809017 RepID=A0ABS2IL73_9GAMM|nr:DUF3299 domain-containing protein [Pseudomonas insulae]MBM7062752.1 DUF3299 domain-containing protein [Pseudomonas insulae]
MLRCLLLVPLLLGTAWAAEPRELTWSEMIPADAPPQEQAPAPLHDLAQLGDALAAEAAPAAKQQAPSAPVVAALDGQQIKLPGYIVPLDVSEEGRVTDFLLVPYFGACIHVPPPPSNQIVHVSTELGVQVDALYQPFWVEGPLRVEASSSEIADAGYRLEASKIYPYELPAN